MSVWGTKPFSLIFTVVLALLPAVYGCAHGPEPVSEESPSGERVREGEALGQESELPVDTPDATSMETEDGMQGALDMEQ